MNKKVICVVEDDDLLRDSLCDLLQSAGYDSIPFNSADQMLTYSGTDSDCILSDIHMPGRDGLEFLRLLRKRGDRTAVILMTADPDETVRARALAGGAAAFVEKPFDAALLLTLVARATQV